MSGDELMGWMPLRWASEYDGLLSAMVTLTEERQTTQVHILVIDLAAEFPSLYDGSRRCGSIRGSG